jgi:outer membrane lipoprotein-sorting protein
MLRKVLLGLLAGAVLTAPAAFAQTVDEIIAKSFEARGGLAKLKAVQSVRMTGKMTMGPGLEAPVTIEMKRPRNARMEFTIQGSTGVQAFDGKQAWGINPMGSRQPEPIPAEMAKDIDEQADIDGPLVDYKAKGNTVELVGKEKVEGSDAYKIKLTRKDGDVEYWYFDAETYIPVKVEAKRTVRGSEIEGETTLGDYKEAGGFLWPYSFQSGAKGRPEKQTLVIDKIEINPAIDDAQFKMPAAKQAEPPKKD